MGLGRCKLVTIRIMLRNLILRCLKWRGGTVGIGTCPLWCSRVGRFVGAGALGMLGLALPCASFSPVVLRNLDFCSH